MAEAVERRGERAQAGIVEAAGRRPRAAGAVRERGEVRVVERVHRQLRLDHRRGGAGAVRQLLQRLGEPGVRVAVAAEQVLAGGARGDEPRAQLGELRRHDREHVEQRRERPLELAGRRERGGERSEQLEPAAVALRHQPQRRRVPARGLGRSPWRGRVAGLREDRDRVVVAGIGAALEVVGPRRQRSAGPLELGRRAGVGAEPPALAGGLIGRAPDDRVAEAVAARQVGGGHEPHRDELVERRRQLALADLPGRRREAEVGRVAGDGPALHEPPRGLVQRRDLLSERHRDGRREVARGQGAARDGGDEIRGPRQLLQVEGVAAAEPEDLLAHARRQGVAEQRVGLLRGERRQADVDDAAVPPCRLERPEHRRRQPAGAERARDQQRRARGAAEQVRDELERGVVGPLQVVEQHDDRRAAGELLQQRAHGAVCAIALVLQRGRRRGVAGVDGGEHAGELGDPVAEHPLQPVGPEPGGVVVERVDPHAERQVALELRAAAGQHGAAALAPAPCQLLQHARLADAGLAAERHVPGIAPEALERGRDRCQLTPAADQGALLEDRRHTGTLTVPVTTRLRR